MSLKNIPVAVLLCLLLFMPGCSRQGQEEAGGKGQPGENAGPVIATVGKNRIHAGAFEQFIKSRHVGMGPHLVKTARKQLKDMLTSEALYQEALRMKIDQTPEVRRRIRQIIIQQLLEEEVEKPVSQWRITDRELREYYERHLDEFSRPEQVRLSDIFIAVPSGATPRQKEEKRAIAEEVLKKARENRNRIFGFRNLISRYSDIPGSWPGGDTGFFDRRGKPAGIPQALVNAAFALKRTGQVADHVIETRDGFHVIMLTGRRSAMKKSLRELAPALKRRMKREERERRRRKFMEMVMNKAHVEINEDAFKKVINDMARKEMNSGHAETPSTGIPAPASRSRGNMPPAFPQTGTFQAE